MTTNAKDSPKEALIERQLVWEQEMVDSGVKAYRRACEAAAAKGGEDSLPGNIALIKRLIEPLAESITEWIESQKSKGQGRRANVVPLMESVDPMAIAFIALRQTMDGISRDKSLLALQKSIGNAIEDEVRLESFATGKPKLFNKLRKDIPKRSKHRRHIRTVLMLYANRSGIEQTGWSDTDAVKVGNVCVELIIKATGLVGIHVIQTSRTRSDTVVRATPAAVDIINSSHARCELLQPNFLPMLVEPNDWDGMYGGGYISDAIDRRFQCFVKTQNKKFIDHMDESADLTDCYDGVNRLQKTAWTINHTILDIAKELWELGHPVGKAMPPRKPEDLPAQPWDIETNPEALLDWKRKAAKVHGANAKRVSRCLQAQRLMQVAEKCSHEDRIFFPYQTDFRGRVYAVPATLNPQGSDLAKALLVFADGMPIDTPEAVSWLAITGAGLFGFDKVSLADRVQWVDDNRDKIISVACDPFGDSWWKDADKPFQFLAWAMEWFHFNEHGMGYVSHYPCQVDGTCNGLQNFAGMLRDETSGAAVNLLPTDEPEDIYRRVAERAVEMLESSDSPYANTWLVYGIDRKLTKRPVMVLPYGGTLHSCRHYIEEALIEGAESGKTNPFADEEMFKASQCLARIVWDAIGDVVVAAREVMAWLQKLASVANKNSQPLCWTTPSGFVVFQRYNETKSKKLELRFPQSITPVKRRQLRLGVTTDDLNKKRQVSGVSPNFIHSMDAAHLIASVNMADIEVGAIHDAYLVHAANAEHLGTCIRQTFVDMYSHNDVLAEFYDAVAEHLPDEVELPDPPKIGNLDLQQVMHSQFFFC